MAPEQAKGRAADKRSDVWAFGCVLYEMLTGRHAFEGEDVSDMLAAVLRGEPDWNALPPDVPPAIRTLIQRCLVKDRHQRIADISTAQYVLDAPTALAALAPMVPAPPQPLWRRLALFSAPALVAAGIIDRHCRLARDASGGGTVGSGAFHHRPASRSAALNK
jgi:serine/threonine protein kinase